MFFDKAKRKIGKRWAVLEEQKLHLYKDESSFKREKEPLEVLDLSKQKKKKETCFCF